MKIVKLNIKDIIFDYRNASDILNRDCFGDKQRRVAGAYALGEDILIWLEDIESEEEYIFDSYVFSQIDEPSEGAIIGEVKNRACFGFSTLTFFEYDNKLWGLFARKREIS